MKSPKHIASAFAALVLLGSATLAAPSEAATLTPAAKAALAGVAAAPTAEEKAVVALIEQVAPGSLALLVGAVRTSPDTATLAASIEQLTATNASLQAVLERGVAALVADPRLAKLAGGAGCAADAASTHSMVRIWCGLPALDPYPVVP